MLDDVSIRERANDEDSEPLRAAVYARTSSKSRELGYSLDEQVKRGVSRCDSLGWDVLFIYRDEAESGSDTDRPMFQEMLSMAPTDVFDVIVFWKLDRFSRSLKHAVELEAELRQSDVYLYSVTEQIDTTSPTGRFNFRNLASAAEFERDMIKQRTNISLNGIASERKWPNDSAPLGYRLTDENKLSIEEETSELVTEIFEMYISEQSMPTVATELNERGIETSAGGEWTPRAVGDILRNRIYKGRYEVGEVSTHVPEYQIIPEDLFERVTEVRMRFQQTDASRTAMEQTRKGELVRDMREQYRGYIGDSG